MPGTRQRVAVVIGTRPQFVKASELVPALEEVGLEVLLIHTGQHYDSQLSASVIGDLGLREPDVNLHVGSGSFSYQLSEGLSRLRDVLSERMPAGVVVIGDSNPALVGAWAAKTTGAILFHCEAGLRNGDYGHPEERNRVLIDAVSDVLFSPTAECVENLERESVRGRIVLAGDLLRDAWRSTYESTPADLPASLSPGGFFLMTLHRRGTVYSGDLLRALVTEILRAELRYPLVWPVHPGVKKRLDRIGVGYGPSTPNLILVPAVPYTQIRSLEINSRAIVSDSVGVQVEAYLAGRRCFIPRTSIEYKALAQIGACEVHPPNEKGMRGILKGLADREQSPLQPDDGQMFGAGESARMMATIVRDTLG